MPASTLHQAPANQIPPVPTGPRRRRVAALVASTLIVLAAGAGAAVALADRPARPAAPADTTAPAPSQVASPPVQAKQPSAQPTATTAPPDQSLVLSDGRHDGFIRKVDTRHRAIVVDIVQVFHDEDAVKAAIQDGKSHADAQYLITYVRNQSSRLRTLPLAGDVRINLLASCEEPAPGEAVLLAKLAKNSSLDDVYYYTLTVKNGAVRQIDEHQVHPAC